MTLFDSSEETSSGTKRKELSHQTLFLSTTQTLFFLYSPVLRKLLVVLNKKNYRIKPCSLAQSRHFFCIKSPGELNAVALIYHINQNFTFYTEDIEEKSLFTYIKGNNSVQNS